MTTCPKCGKAVPASSRYCAYCSAAIPPRFKQWLARVDWPFLGRWLAISALACGLAWLVLTHQSVAGLLAGAGAAAVPLRGLLAGVVVAGGQWLVLRARVHDRRGWLLALPAGWGLAFSLWSVWPQIQASYPWLEPAGAMVVPLAVLGALAGYVQWPLARYYAWPAQRWALASALAPALAACAITLALPGDAPGGWFMKVALRTGGRPVFAATDLSVAGLIGLALGIAQYPLIRRSVALAPIWPLATAAGTLAGALVVDGLFALAQVGAMGFGSPGIMVYWYDFAGGWAGATVAWGFTAAGLGASQALFLRLAAALPPALAGRASSAAAQPEGPGRLWTPLTAAGGAAGAVAAWQLGAGGWLLLAAAGAGLLAGLPQWWAARPDFKSAAWLPVVAVAGWSVPVGIAQVAHLPLLAQNPPGLPAFIALLAILPGCVLALRG